MDLTTKVPFGFLFIGEVWYCSLGLILGLGLLAYVLVQIENHEPKVLTTLAPITAATTTKTETTTFTKECCLKSNLKKTSM